jgi:hypothetical protein
MVALGGEMSSTSVRGAVTFAVRFRFITASSIALTCDVHFNSHLPLASIDHYNKQPHNTYTHLNQSGGVWGQPTHTHPISTFPISTFTHPPHTWQYVVSPG